MIGTKAIVTGANSGIGLVTAKRLAELGAEVLMVCRDAERGRHAQAEVARVASGAKPGLFLADLGNQQSIRRLANEVVDAHDRAEVLVNNAGAVFGKRELTPDGIEKTFATNHIGPFLLTHLLLPVLRRASAARIVTVASRVHAGSLDFDNLQGERRYSAMRAYECSKLENILFTYELARRLGPGSITANCLAPGLVSSNFGRNVGGLLGLMPRVLALTPFSVSPEEGAKTSIYLASSPEVEGVTGRYYYRCKETESKPVSYDRRIAERLWEISARLVGVQSSGLPANA